MTDPIGLSVAPADGYRWDTFFEDQTARPFIYHGTSSVFEQSIRAQGLTLDCAPYDSGQVAEVVSIFDAYDLHGEPRYNIGALKYFTSGSMRGRSISFTFDYTRACFYAWEYRGGETVHHLWRNLNWALDPPRAAFTKGETAFLMGLRDQIDELVEGHKPMVVGVEFDLERFHGPYLDFFCERSLFVRCSNDKDDITQGPRRFLGYRLPGFELKGAEYRTNVAISPTRIRSFSLLDVPLTQ
jgi:hypothetical protein